MTCTARCMESTSTRCRCSCGGATHGVTAHITAQFEQVRAILDAVQAAFPDMRFHPQPRRLKQEGGGPA